MNGGLIILDKPSGMTSRRAGGIVARIFGFRKFGHIGTLDPMASGVLPIALGEATKMIPYLEEVGARGNAPAKEYLFSIKWGVETDTGDTDGHIINTNTEYRIPNTEEIEKILPSLIGEIEQTPPQYSAIKINGKKAYDLARRGIAVDMPVRRVNIYNLSVSSRKILQSKICAGPGKDISKSNISDRDDLSRSRDPLTRPRDDTYIVQCSPGTYVRTLVQQIAAKLGAIATTSMIRRTRSSGFEIKDSVALAILENLYNNRGCPREFLRPIDFGLDDILVLELNDADADSFKNGGFVKGIRHKAYGIIRVYNNDKFIGIGEVVDDMLKPKRIIN